MELEWIANRSASALAAAAAVIAGRPVVESSLTVALAQPVGELQAQLATAGVPAATFFAHAVPLSLGIDSPHELAAAVLAKTLGGDKASPHVAPLAAAIGGVCRAAATAQPDLLDELEARSRPLIEQWEARGPGLLASIARTTEPHVLVERATLALVAPVSGGGGAAHVLYNAVSFEAVLTNPTPELPEIVRMAWLLSQLNGELPRYAECLPAGRAETIVRLAMIPAALEAAAHVELASDDPQLLARALAAWRVSTPADTVPTLDTWWRTHRETHPAWPVALAALATMLPG